MVARNAVECYWLGSRAPRAGYWVLVRCLAPVWKRRISVPARCTYYCSRLVPFLAFLDARPPLGVVACGGVAVVPGGLCGEQDPGEFLIAAAAPSGVPWW